MTTKIKKKWKVLIAFLLATFIYSIVVNCKHYGYGTPVKGKVIYYSIPHCYVPTLPCLKKPFNAIFKHGEKVPFGHAGIIIEDDKGILTLYQYGRFKQGIGHILKGRRGNWKRQSFGNRNGRSDKELMKYLGPRILNGTNLHDTGGRVDAYFMDVDDVTPAIDYIERDAANPKRARYFFFSDNTCGGVARDAFDRTRCYPSRVLNKWFDIVGNFIPFPSHIWSALTHSGNISGLSGLSPEGNAPSLNTNKEIYRTSNRKYSWYYGKGGL